MKSKILAFFLAFLILAPVLPANAKIDTRYFVKNNANLWKNSFNARNSFEGGFTADLTDWQLRVAKLFGIEVEPVAKYFVSPSIVDDTTTSGRRPATRIVPTAQVPWGIATLYDLPELASTSGGNGVTVAVLDTGIIKTHPDLVDRVGDCRDYAGPKGGFAAGKCEDKNGHGTHVAGIVAADGGKDTKGIYGMAPEVTLFAYKVCDPSGSCWADDIAVALHAAVDNGAQIINVSLGSDAESPLIKEAIDYASDHGALVIAAAGNDGPDTGSIDYPGANARAVAVGAIDDKLIVPDWSSRGINLTTDPNEINEKDLEFVAPGVNVESTWKDGGYAVLSGTSMATPHITGLAALYWDAAASDSAQTVRALLKTVARDIGALGEDNDSGFGLPVLTQ